MGKSDEVVRYVAEGFCQDSNNLLEEFCASGSLEFPAFCKIWKSHNVSLVFMGRETEAELKEFTGEAYIIVLHHLSENSSMSMNVGVLYMLYALYTKQPLEPRFKIRVNRTQWDQLVSLKKYGCDEKQYWISVIFEKMVTFRAFNFSIFPRLCGPMVTLPTEAMKSLDKDTTVSDLKQNLNDLVETNLFLNIDKASKLYAQAKENLSEEQRNVLNLTLKDESAAMAINFKNLASTGKLDFKVIKSLKAVGGSDDTDSVDNQIGDRRRDLKKKQFSTFLDSVKIDRCKTLLQEGSMEEMVVDGEDSNSRRLVITEGGDSVLEKNTTKRARWPRKPKRGKGRPKKYAPRDAESDDQQEEPDKKISMADNVKLEGKEAEYVLKIKPQRCRKIRFDYAHDSDDEDPFPSFTDDVPKWE